jgi:hypothetical protein
MVYREMARPKRFELLTPRFVVWCSIQLSYGRVFRKAFRDPGGRRCRMHSEIISEVAKARHSYRLRTGLARCALALSGSRFTLKRAS